MVEVPPVPPNRRPVFYLPAGANIPREWIIRRNLYRQVVVWPSASIPGLNYELGINLDSRKVTCNCPGFNFRGTCRHIRHFLSSVYKKKRKKGVQDTSLAAYYSFSPEELEQKQRAVYEALLQGPATDKELAAWLHWPINCITPRRGELCAMGAVAEYGRIAGPSGRPETVWVALDTLREDT